MGEFSKVVGEVGEGIVINILSLMGWVGVTRNIEFSCCTKSHAKRTHGIDALFLYESPLESNSIENIIVSSKFSSNGYYSVPSTFKSHFADLARTIECYSKSSDKRDYNSSFSKGMRKNDVGVLFYFNSDLTPGAQDILSQVTRARIDPDLKFRHIHLIDNNRASFLYDSLSHLHRKYGDRRYFYYPSTSLNIAAKEKKYYSPIMPVEFISAPIIPLIIESEDGKQPTLCLVTSEPINEESVELLINVARDFSHDLTKNISILFPSFNVVDHQPLADKAKMARSNDNKPLNITINSYNESYVSQV